MLTVLLVLVAIVVLALLGVAVLGVALQLLWWALVGLVIGGLARLVLPGPQPIGGLATVGAGIAGALLGGLVADALEWGGLLQLVLAVGCAALLVAALGGSRRAYA
ncbi:MAG TPA: hypothetical protein VNJ53_06135 [Gaiellaceae bacterium]|nr:hypothetical protein [Gaiellaceae bacterium]